MDASGVVRSRPAGGEGPRPASVLSGGVAAGDVAANGAAGLSAAFREVEATLSGGVLGVCATADGVSWVTYNADVSFPTASTIKAAIVAELLARVEDGAVSLGTRVEIGAADFVAGSGVLAGLEPGHSFTLGELARLAISVSDNTASNVVLAAVGGPESVNRRMRGEWGMTGTVIHRPIRFHVGAGDPPHTATGTPADMCRFMWAVATGTLHSPGVSSAVMGLLAMCDDTEMLPRYLDVNAFAGDLDVAAPPLRVFHKPGAVTGVRNDAGVVLAGGGSNLLISSSSVCGASSGGGASGVALSVYTKGIGDGRWTAANVGCEAVARVSRLLVSYFMG